MCGCCCLSADPPKSEGGNKSKTFETDTKFQTGMCKAPCAGGVYTCCWCVGQCVPLTCGITQFFLRRKVLEGDMSKYRCCQGYYMGFGSCCKKRTCCESTCPSLCLCMEAHCCNFAAVSASRMLVMERYNLSSDACDYTLIRINNCLQCLACVCNVLAVIGIPYAREFACLINIIADIVYGFVSGCMTAQTAHEMNYQLSVNNHGKHVPVDGKVQPMSVPASLPVTVQAVPMGAPPPGGGAGTHGGPPVY